MYMVVSPKNAAFTMSQTVCQTCLKYNIVITINNTFALVLEQIHTHSLQGFSKYAIRVHTDISTGNGIIKYCYICNRNENAPSTKL